jgi:hypothetical protein
MQGAGGRGQGLNSDVFPCPPHPASRILLPPQYNPAWRC